MTREMNMWNITDNKNILLDTWDYLPEIQATSELQTAEKTNAIQQDIISLSNGQVISLGIMFNYHGMKSCLWCTRESAAWC